jgi:hypothetical protein
MNRQKRAAWESYCQRRVNNVPGGQGMTIEEALTRVRAGITMDRCKQLFVELVKVPSPQTELMEN